MRIHCGSNDLFLKKSNDYCDIIIVLNFLIGLLGFLSIFFYFDSGASESIGQDFRERTFEPKFLR